MTTCKHCDKEIFLGSDGVTWFDTTGDLPTLCTYTRKAHEPAEPSTEGTPPKYYRIIGGYTGKVIGVCTEKEDVLAEEPNATFEEISKEEFDSYGDAESSVPQAAQPECNAVHPANEDTYCRRKKGHFGNHSAPCFVAHPSGASSIDWSAAPVAQVDARARVLAAYPDAYQIETGFIITPLICGRDVPNDCIGCSWEDAASKLPAVAQTELPPIPEARLREMASGMDGLTPADCADTKEIDAMVPELISLRERIAMLEAREAELKAEIAQWMTWGTIEVGIRNPNVASYMDHWETRARKAEFELAASAKRHDDRMEALERSHKALLQCVKAYSRGHVLSFNSHECGGYSNDSGDVGYCKKCEDAQKAIAAAEKL